MKLKFSFPKKTSKLNRLAFRFFSAIILLSFSARAIAVEVNPEFQDELLKWETPELPSLGEPELYLYAPQEIYDVEVVIRLNKRRVYVYQKDQEIASFPIAIGKKGWETPQGKFEVIQMVEGPSWQNPWTGKVVPAGPNSPLGDRWIGFWSDGENYIGFHGTPGEHLIGQAVSHGCVRMKNKDVRALFDLVNFGTTVTVKP